MNEKKPVLIVGLGNPGARYARTRHNVGFMAVDAMAGPGATWRAEHKSLTTKKELHTSHSTLHTILAKPQTFMNLSGAAVQSLMTFYKIPLENVVVIHDEVDLPPGTVREKTGGGSAGHNGIKSIDAAVGNNYRRIRIGVGRPDKTAPSSVSSRKNSPGILSGIWLGFGDVLSRSGALACASPGMTPSTADWVLGKFSDEEMKAIDAVIAEIEI